MKKNKTNRTDLFLIASFIIIFVTFWLQILAGVLGKMNMLTCLNFIIYSISSCYLFYNTVDKKDTNRIRKIVFGTGLMVIILEIIYLIILTIRAFADLGTGL